MDDSAGTVANGGLGGVIPNVGEEHLWHSIPQNGTAVSVTQRKNALWEQVLREENADLQLKRLGVFFHYQQDSWAHRHHPNHDATNFTSYKVPFGHAADGHQPDRPPFDPVCALRCLEEGIGYARTFVASCLHREPNKLFDAYQSAKGEQVENWNDVRQGKYFNQLSSDISTPARSFLTDLIRAQINAYASSMDKNPISPYFGRNTADEAKYDRVREQLQDVCNRHQIQLTIPMRREKITTLTTAQLNEGNLGTLDYAVRIYTGDKLWAGTDSNIFLSLKGTTGEIGEQRLNGLITGNAFERNQTDTCVLRGLAMIGDIESITIRSDDQWPASDWYLGWVEISSPGVTTQKFTLNDWIEKGKLKRTITR